MLKADESGDIEEVEQGEQFKEHRWICGSLYEDTNDVFRLEFGDENEDEPSNVLMFLLSAAGALKVSVNTSYITIISTTSVPKTCLTVS